MISSNLARAGHPSRVKVAKTSSEGQQMGIHSDSVIMTDNLAIVHENEIDRSIGHVSDMSAVAAAMKATLGL